MSRKHLESIYHANVKVDLIEENVTQFNNGIMMNVSASVMHVKKDCV